MIMGTHFYNNQTHSSKHSAELKIHVIQRKRRRPRPCRAAQSQANAFRSFSETQKVDIERYLDKKLQATTVKQPLHHLIMMDKDHMPAELVRDGQKIVKRVKWDNEIDLSKLDQFEKLEEKNKDTEENEEEEVEEEGNEEDGEISDDGDYEQNQDFDDDEDDYNMAEENDEDIY
ncbi:glutamic acid-rich protein-like isoform X3 [Salvia hispanica]|uniref:glutamic acid-rich protein-like isoform X3 n=1 Tax=Salvia hispanica TaxID=49212 RepID=UPI002009C514|nr:glutamic acid-rich protein-like isoform X3 [Salvia hispanica]